jgi:glycosyltransferase involved in cell wall biosynthesis
MTKKIVNVGIYPPPFGGVSNHIKRLHEFLIKNGYDTLLLDTSGIKKEARNLKNINRKLVLLDLFFKKKSVIHFHGFDIKTLLLAALLSIRHKVILSPHNEWFFDQMNAYGKLIYGISAFLMNRLDILIVANNNSVGFAEKFMQNKKRIRLVPAFIPPVLIPELENENLLKTRKQHKFLISTNAFKIDFYKGVDVYGLDLFVDAMNILCNKYQLDLVLVFLLPNIGNPEYFEKMKNRIKEHGIEEKILFITTPLPESSSLWKISDVIIRATSTDGNSLTILEGLNLGIPVIASDCIERPHGTILFRNRDAGDMAEKIKDTLLNYEVSKKRVQKLNIINSAEEIIKIYNELQTEQ